MRECTKILVADLEKEEQSPLMVKILDRAKRDYYHDFFGGADLPELELLNDLTTAHASEEIKDNVVNGKYDASKEDSEEWSKSKEGREVFGELFGKHGKNII
jgi:hypothetical protein